MGKGDRRGHGGQSRRGLGGLQWMDLVGQGIGAGEGVWPRGLCQGESSMDASPAGGSSCGPPAVLSGAASPLPTSPGSPGGLLGPLQAGSPNPFPLISQMTAWAHLTWTSRPTSPSSPTRPASASEQCCLSAADAAIGRVHGCHHRRRGLCFFRLFFYFLFCLFCLHLHPLPPHPHFQFFSSALCQTPLRGPSGPASRILSCPHLSAQTRTGETPRLPQDRAFGQLGRFQFLNNTSPNEEGRWSQVPTGGLPLRCCLWRLPSRGSSGGQGPGATFHACRWAPSGLARGQSAPLLPWEQKSNNVEG